MKDRCTHKKLVPMAVDKVMEVKGFPSRWKMIILELERLPSCLLNLLTHSCFSKNALCK
ncbi:hypothetical protein ES319_D07G121900v1 [Gossypium barbadense]|uniref:DUF7032 domain-containing protein n=1 Tax=Gossypium barbadense TaxID=3634 RepID=A0A5J5QTC7_GOSBA|nr:hypothetical protein ES319_D07G121900v1 [Gossypium barbadense]KAB2021189.1 hypothetical protein ES319_D07G121900v1 [Gossypium barbadense]KAB2021190.1 hypothetical protein ES319_D07G121900v1 [Gossypium barbadense]